MKTTSTRLTPADLDLDSDLELDGDEAPLAVGPVTAADLGVLDGDLELDAE